MTARIVLVTGANRGIGLCIVQALATRSPTDQIILAARSPSTIEPAIAQLRAAGVQNELTALELDVTNDESIETAAAVVKEKFGQLDVLVNNAGVASIPDSSLAATRKAFATILDTNVSSVATVCAAMLPLMQTANTYKPRVINISSGRASLTRSTTGRLPPTASVPYSVSKVALNALTTELQKANPHVLFYAANPGHCKTAFNGFKGARDPLEGARVVVELVAGEREYPSGFWEAMGAEGEATMVPW